MEAYVEEMRKATQSLIAQRLMLPADAEVVIDGSPRRYAQAIDASRRAAAATR